MSQEAPTWRRVTGLLVLLMVVAICASSAKSCVDSGIDDDIREQRAAAHEEADSARLLGETRRELNAQKRQRPKSALAQPADRP